MAAWIMHSKPIALLFGKERALNLRVDMEPLKSFPHHRHAPRCSKAHGPGQANPCPAVCSIWGLHHSRAAPVLRPTASTGKSQYQHLRLQNGMCT